MLCNILKTMFTIECQDPNCVECRRAATERSSEEDNRSTMPKTVEQNPKQENCSKIPETAGQSSEEESQRKLVETVEKVIASDLLSAHEARRNCLSNSLKLKEQVRYEINKLISLLKEREQDLCAAIEKEYTSKVEKIDFDLTSNCVDKILNRFDETKCPPPETRLVFRSDFDALERSVVEFGRLTYGDNNEVIKSLLKKPPKGSNICARSLLAARIKSDPKPTFGAQHPALSYAAIAAELKNEKEMAESGLKINLDERNPLENQLKKMAEESDLKINLDGRNPVEVQPMSAEERHLRRKMHVQKIRQLREKEMELGPTRVQREEEMKLPGVEKVGQPAPKVYTKDSKIVVEDTVSEAPKTSNGRLSSDSCLSYRDFHSLIRSRSLELKMVSSMVKNEHKLPLTPSGYVRLMHICKNNVRDLNKVANAKDKLKSVSKEDIDQLEGLIKDWVELEKTFLFLSVVYNKQSAIDSKDATVAAQYLASCKGKLGNMTANAFKTAMPLEQDTVNIENLQGKDIPWTPETLSSQIEKRLEMFVPKVVAADKKLDTTNNHGNFETLDLVPNQEPEQNNCVEFKKNEEFKNPWAKLESLAPEEIPSESFESTDTSSSEDLEKDSSLDEDDIEIISKLETDSIPSDLPSPPLPPKNRFKFGGKPSRFSSLLRRKDDKKPDLSARSCAKSESSGIGESESQKSSLGSATCSGINTKVKENPSFNDQPRQESSSECLGGSDGVGPSNDPTLALRSSLKKYLEKNPGSEWLATGGSTEKSKATGNGSREKVVPTFVQEVDHWLPRGFNQKEDYTIVTKLLNSDFNQIRKPPIVVKESEWLYNAPK